MSGTSNKSYMAHDVGDGKIHIKEIPSGNLVHIISLPMGATLLTPPMISGDHLSYTCLVGGTVRKGFVHKVPSGSIVNIFSG